MNNKTRYADKELKEFRNLIEEKIDKAKADLELLRSAYMNNGNNGTDDTAPTFKAFEEGSETMSKEANTQLAIRQEKFIRDLKNALVRIENKTYGICRVTGKLINKKNIGVICMEVMRNDYPKNGFLQKVICWWKCIQKYNFTKSTKPK